MIVDGIKLTWGKDLPLDHPVVAARVTEALADPNGSLMIDESCRFGHKHLRPHRDRAGNLFVRVGRRGSGKQIIDRCDVTYFDGVPTLWQFKFVKSEWELRAEAKWNEQAEGR